MTPSVEKCSGALDIPCAGGVGDGMREDATHPLEFQPLIPRSRRGVDHPSSGEALLVWVAKGFEEFGEIFLFMVFQRAPEVKATFGSVCKYPCLQGEIKPPGHIVSFFASQGGVNRNALE